MVAAARRAAFTSTRTAGRTSDLTGSRRDGRSSRRGASSLHGWAALRPSAHDLVPNAVAFGWLSRLPRGLAPGRPRAWGEGVWHGSLRGSVATGVAPPRRSSAEGVPFRDDSRGPSCFVADDVALDPVRTLLGTQPGDVRARRRGSRLRVVFVDGVSVGAPWTEAWQWEERTAMFVADDVALDLARTCSDVASRPQPGDVRARRRGSRLRVDLPGRTQQRLVVGECKTCGHGDVRSEEGAITKGVGEDKPAGKIDATRPAGSGRRTARGGGSTATRLMRAAAPCCAGSAPALAIGCIAVMARRS